VQRGFSVFVACIDTSTLRQQRFGPFMVVVSKLSGSLVQRSRSTFVVYGTIGAMRKQQRDNILGMPSNRHEQWGVAILIAYIDSSTMGNYQVDQPSIMSPACKM
jgi:hypothetical protein